MTIHAQLSRMTTPHAPASPVSVHPSEDAGVPLSEERLAVLEYEHSDLSPADEDGHLIAELIAEVKRLRALASSSSSSPVPAPTPAISVVRDADGRLRVDNRPPYVPKATDVVAALTSLEKAWPVLLDHAPHLDGEFDLALTAVRRMFDAFRTALATPQPPREDEISIHPDTARLDTAQRLLRGCDFAWGDPDAPRSVVVLDIPQGVRVGADFRAFLDAATPEAR